MLSTNWNPVQLALAVAVALAALIPLVISLLLWLCNKKSLMGHQVSGWASNLTLTVALIATLLLTWQAAAGLGD